MALKYDPTTGSYVDDVTGQVSHSADGTVPSTNTDLNSQAGRSLGISNQLLGSLAQYGGQFNQAQQGQNQLGAYLSRVITGAAPSVAGQQLQQSLGQIKSGIDSSTSGATGNNAALANYGGTQAYADAAAKANSDAAIARTQEVNAAQAAKGSLLGQQANENAGMFGTVLGGANQNSATAAGVGQTQADIDQKNRQAWLNLIGNLTQAGGSALVAGGTRGAPAAPAA